MVMVLRVGGWLRGLCIGGDVLFFLTYIHSICIYCFLLLGMGVEFGASYTMSRADGWYIV